MALKVYVVPSKATVCSKEPYVSAEAIGSGTYCACLSLDDGPSPIKIITGDGKEHEIRKGEGLAVCEDGGWVNISWNLHFMKAGKYRLSLLSGKVVGKEMHYDDKYSFTVDVKERTAAGGVSLGTRELATATASFIALGSSLLALPANKKWVAAPITLGTAAATYLLFPKLSGKTRG